MHMLCFNEEYSHLFQTHYHTRKQRRTNIEPQHIYAHVDKKTFERNNSQREHHMV